MTEEKNQTVQEKKQGKRQEKKQQRQVRHQEEKKYRIVENKKRMTVIYSVLRFAVIAVMVAQFFNGNYENVFLCVLTLVLFMMPSMIERKLKVDLPDTLEVIILLFIFAAEILGEIQAYYIQFPYWDTLLHTLNGFLAAAIGFSLVDLLNRSEQFTFRLSPLYVSLAAFCFSMTVGVLWEFFECFMDRVFLLDMQKDTVLSTISSVSLDPQGANHPIVMRHITDTILVFEDGSQQALGLGGYLDLGIYDTMKDLFVNFIGAVVFSFVGYFYVKARGKGRFARRFIPAVQDLDKDATPGKEEPKDENAAGPEPEEDKQEDEEWENVAEQEEAARVMPLR